MELEAIRDDKKEGQFEIADLSLDFEKVLDAVANVSIHALIELFVKCEASIPAKHALARLEIIETHLHGSRLDHALDDHLAALIPALLYLERIAFDDPPSPILPPAA